jgi:dihydrofolate reductase
MHVASDPSRAREHGLDMSQRMRSRSTRMPWRTCTTLGAAMRPRPRNVHPFGADGMPRARTRRSPRMARLVATMFMTLDGMVQDPHTWQGPYWSDDAYAFKLQELRNTDALLLGRVTYELFASSWPGRTDPDGFADKFNSMPKYVATRTLDKLAWNAHALRGDLAGEVAKLKRRPGKDIAIHGSVSVVNALTRHGLIDRFHLLVFPLVLGGGTRLFDKGTSARLRLAEARTLQKGAQLLVYEPEAASPGPAG